MMEIIMEQLDIDIHPTPNPNALKFVLNKTVKKDGNSTYKSPAECGENRLANRIFTIRGVDQIHFFENVITVTKFGYEEWGSVEPQIRECIQGNINEHNADYYDPDPEAERRRNLSPELSAIEEILDKTIRPGLQGDGGDIQCLSFKENILLVKYKGACGTCPSSTQGTLEAIKGILRDQYHAEIDVFIAPEY